MLSKDKTLEASQALLKYINNQKQEDTGSKKDLLADEEEDAETIYLTISTKKYLTDKKQLKPKKIVLPHPLRTKESTSICLFTKDPQRTYKDALQTSGSNHDDDLVQRVVGVSKLKGKFKPYQARRSLLSGHDVFLAEDSVVTTLPKLLGKVFYDGPVSRMPLSIKLSSSNDGDKTAVDPQVAEKEINKVINSTVFTLSPGTMASISVGKSTFTAKQLEENIQAVADYFVNNVREWDGIRALHIKAQKSQSLPIFVTETLYSEGDVATAESGDKAEGEEDKQDDKKRKRKQKGSQLNDLETALTEHFEDEDLEKFTKKKIKTDEEDNS